MADMKDELQVLEQFNEKLRENENKHHSIDNSLRDEDSNAKNI